MKNWSFLILAALFLGGMTLAISSCSDDDGEDAPTCNDGIQNGNETGVDCGGDCDPCLIGIMGEWQSSGANVAPLLVGPPLNTDSIYADFRTDNTYLVEQFNTDGVRLVLEGTFTQEPSGEGDIWNITVMQTSPTALTSEGIFEVTGTTMMYEIVQTNPDIGFAPPTAAAGFGSTAGGALGNTNVQVYERIE